MSQVVSGVTEKLQDLMPGKIGSNARYETSSVERLIMLADRAVRERTSNLYHQQEITLVTNQSEYTLDSEFIDVVSVEYASDGSTYDESLESVTLDDLDKFDFNWRNVGGIQPECYTLLSAPGTPTAKILIWQPLASAGVQTIRVTGRGIGTSTAVVPDDVQAKCHVPYVMAMLTASEPQKAATWFARFLNGCDEVASRTRNKYVENPVRVR